MNARRLGYGAAALLVGAIVNYAVVRAPHVAPHPHPNGPSAPVPVLVNGLVPVAAAMGYPRLANYNGLRYRWQVPFFSTYGLVIARRGAPVHQLKRANPHVITLLYERTLQSDLCCLRSLYGLTAAQVPPQWWLVTAGSRLARAINRRQQWITVADPAPFARCQDVLVDGESMHIWAVRGHLLHVWRGYFSAARTHRAGARIAPHYSYRGDLSNCRVSGRASSIRPWSFNLSSACPRWHGQTWAGYLSRRMAYLLRREGWDGVFYDNLSDFPPSPLVDVNDDGKADGGIIHGVNIWRAGERALLAATRRLAPRARLMVNGDLLIDGLAAGREMEGFPLIPGLDVSAAIDAYLYDGAHGAPLTIVNPDSVDRSYPNMPGVQLAVGASLLGDGFAAYDQGWLDHGFPWWFDEFDGGAGSATLHPLDAAAMLVPVAHAERFHRGDVVLFNAEAARVLRVLGQGLLLQRGIANTLPSWQWPRTVMTTPTQRRHARGYLGRPLGPAYLLSTSAWSRYAVRLTLRRGPALLEDRRPHTGTQAVTPISVSVSVSVPVTPRLRLSVQSVLHYQPAAVRVVLEAPASPLALRTLEFTARGPAGESIWVGDGEGATPVALRQSWHRYVLPVDGAARLTLDLGRVGGRVEISGLRLIGIQAFVWRRDFAHGLVLVNPTDTVQRPRLDRPYRVLSGDQDPWANSGRLTRAIAVARYRAVILLSP